MCDTFVWMAENWYRGDEYSNTSLDVELCRAGTHSLECAYIDPPDEFTWDTVCAVGMPDFTNAPPPSGDWTTAWSWIFTDWLPFYWEVTNDTIEHLARCMFQPPGGWDPGAKIESAWGSSAFTHIAGLLEDAGDAFTFTESCGVIADLPPILASQPINTCTWSSWAPPVKTFLTWTGWLAFGVWAIWFLVQTMLAAIRAVPVPNPLVSDVAEVRATEQIGR